MVRVLNGGLLRLWRNVSIALVSGIAVTACATTPAPSSHMPSGGVAMPPAGLLDMCQRLPEVCGDAGHTARTALSETLVLASASEPATGAVMAGPGYDGSKASSAPEISFIEVSSREAAQSRKIEPMPAVLMEGEGDSAIAALERETAQPALPVDADGTLIADSALFSLLNRVNQSINMAIRPRDDIDVHGVEEFWTLPLSVEGIAEGDCEDYALEKRRALMEAGIPESALFLAVGYSRATGRHAVLVVSTDSGDYVLDNMTPYITPWSQAPYTWLLRQVPGDLLACGTQERRFPESNGLNEASCPEGLRCRQ